MKISLSYLMLCAALVVAGCNDEEEKPEPKGKYNDGVLVVNEGQFLSSNASVTFYNPSSNEVEQNIFPVAGGFAGDVAQSLTIKDDKGYLVINEDSKIHVLDAHTFASLSTISDPEIVKPRYVEVIGDKAYISVWGVFADDYSLLDSYVAVYDLKTNTVIKKIDTDEGVENLLYDGKYLYASNYNYGASSTLAVINPADNSLVKQIELAAGPTAIVLDNNKKIWVITTGNFNMGDGKLFKINPNTLQVEQTIELGVNPGMDLSVTPDKKNLIYSANNNIYKISIDASSAPPTPFFIASDVVALYSSSVHPQTGDIYVGEAYNFATEGVVYVYNADGSVKYNFPTGIAPTQFVFN
jgi:hypothetical protein